MMSRTNSHNNSSSNSVIMEDNDGLVIAYDVANTNNQPPLSEVTTAFSLLDLPLLKHQYRNKTSI